MRTVSLLQSLLGTYIRPGGVFMDALNQVLERLNQMGTWKEMKTEWEVDASPGYVCLPPDYESILAANLRDSPVYIQDMMLEYEDTGVGTLDRPVSQGYGIIDRGMVPLMSDLPLEGLASLDFNITTGSFASGMTITVEYFTANGRGSSILSPTSGTSVTLTPSDPMTNISGISYTGLTARVLAQADDSDLNTITYAILLPGSNTCQFRRYEVLQADENTTSEWTLRTIVKRAFIPVTSLTDRVFLDNISALKHGLLAVLAEDDSDLDKAEKHWEKSLQALRDALRANRGGVKPHPQIHTWGLGVPSLPSRY